MKSIEELALKVADQVQFSTSKPFTCDQIVDFAIRFLAAYTEQQEPACYIVKGDSPEGAAYGYSASYPEAVHEHINDTIQRLVDEDLTPPVMHCVPLFAAPVVPADMVLVPREPTEAMIGNEWNRDMLAGIWRAMIAAGEVKP